MGLNLSTRQIAAELGLDGSDVQATTEHLRHDLAARIAPAKLTGEVEIDEVYIVAGHKGQPAEVAKRGGRGGAASGRGCPGGARRRRKSRRLEAVPPTGLIQRGGQAVLQMLPNVRQATIKPVIQDAVAPGALVHTAEYAISARVPAGGYRHKTVCHARGEYEHTGRYPSQTAANAARKSNGHRSRSPPVPARVRSSGDQRGGGEWACWRGVPRRYTDARAGQRNRPLPRFA